jgi:hypothetical protein
MCNELTRKLTTSLITFFEKEIEIPRIRQGKRQTVETLINEEAQLVGKYLRNEKEDWKPRISKLNEINVVRINE